MIINYNEIDRSVHRTIKSIENKPHVRYIRYLLTKRFSPVYIKKELYRIGLSAPHEDQLIRYYMVIIDVLIHHYGLDDFYKSYRRKLTSRDPNRGPGEYAKHILNYREVFGDAIDYQPNFHYFIRHLEIGDLWGKEIMEYHKTVTNLPSDEKTGKKILSLHQNLHYEKVLACDKRYIIERLIMDGLSNTRIAEIIFKQHGINNISAADIAGYRTLFFDSYSVNLIQMIEALETERAGVKEILTALSKKQSLPGYKDMTEADRLNIKEQNDKRLRDLEDNLRYLYAQHTDASFRHAEMKQVDLERLFMDMFLRTHSRYVSLDTAGTVEMIDPLCKMGKLSIELFNTITKIKSDPTWQQATDIASEENIFTMYKNRVDELSGGEFERANSRLEQEGYDSMSRDIGADDIDGIDEVSLTMEGLSELSTEK